MATTFAALTVVASGVTGAGVPTAEAASTTYRFGASGDTFVDALQPAKNFGTSPRLEADTEPRSISYLKFKVSGLSGTVTSAKLKLYVTNSSHSGGTINRMSNTGWAESAVTFNDRPAVDGALVATLPGVVAGTWVTVNVTAAVKANGMVSFGLRSGARDGADYASRQSPEFAPRLYVTTGTGTPPADTTAPSVAIVKPASTTTVTTAGVLAVEAHAGDASGVRKVEFYDNGRYIGTEETTPFGYSWRVDSSDNGTHRWTARAYDAHGNTATSPAVTVTVNVPTAVVAPRTGSVTATAETAPVPHTGDAADDPAIWRHPTDPAKSLVIGTDKEGGLALYDLAGRQLQYIAGIRPNNVDIRGDIVTASERNTDTISVYRVDAATRRLVDVRAVARATGFGVSGLCMYKDGTTLYVFVTDSSGHVRQFRLFRTSTGRYDYTEVRRFTVSTGEIEGCVADDVYGAFYVSDENVAIWRYGADPSAGTTRVRVDGHSSGHLVGDIEGLTLLALGTGQGYLIASSQGSNSYAVYDRVTRAYRGSFTIGDGAVDGVSYTDGIAASGSLGLFVAQDDDNDGGNQNFKLVAWPRIAKALGLAYGSSVLSATAATPLAYAMAPTPL